MKKIYTTPKLKAIELIHSTHLMAMSDPRENPKDNPYWEDTHKDEPGNPYWKPGWGDNHH